MIGSIIFLSTAGCALPKILQKNQIIFVSCTTWGRLTED